MKKAAQAQPNTYLKRERELRGWSQKYVAEQLGADLYAVSRWERGLTSPSPYYRQQLCQLFGRDASQLGLVAEQLQESDASARQKSIFVSHQARLDDPELPLPPTVGGELIGRGQLLAELKEYLCSEASDHLIAISGLPGVGKTTLALALTYSGEIQAQFYEGCLWAGLGPSPDVQGILSRWAKLLGVSAQEMARFKSVDELMKAMRTAIGKRRFLLIIDDVWRIEAALAFKVGGQNCGYLLTTRFPGLAQSFAPDFAVKLHELSEDEGLTLLTRVAREAVVQEENEARRLVQAVGGLPLALNIMGKYLRLQAHAEQPRRIRAALQRLRSTEERLRLTSPVGYLERPPGLGDGVPFSLQTIIALSDQQLAEQEKQALRALAVFPTKPNSFSEEAALAVGDTRVEILDVLSDAGLLESSGAGRYTLHQTVGDYARLQSDECAARIRLAGYFADYAEAHIAEEEQLEREMSNMVAALEAAHHYDVPRALLRCVHACARLWERYGQYEQAELHLERAREAAPSLQDEAALLTTMSHLGRVLLARGAFARAEEYLHEGLTLARQHGDAGQECEFLRSLGTLWRYRGDYAQAKYYLQASLALAQQPGKEELTATLLNALGALAGEQGRYDDAEHYLSRGLELARASESAQAICSALHGLGTLVSMRGDYQQAETYYLEAATLARQSRETIRLGLLLTNLGSLAGEQGHYEQAEQYLQESLVLARQLGHPQNLCMLFANLGEVESKQGKYSKAEEHYQEGLTLARQFQYRWDICIFLTLWGNHYLLRAEESEEPAKRAWLEKAESAFEEALQECPEQNRKKEADILFGLARVAYLLGASSKAVEYASASLRFFEEAQDVSAAQVRQLLQKASAQQQH